MRMRAERGPSATSDVQRTASTDTVSGCEAQACAVPTVRQALSAHPSDRVSLPYAEAAHPTARSFPLLAGQTRSMRRHVREWPLRAHIRAGATALLLFLLSASAELSAELALLLIPSRCEASVAQIAVPQLHTKVRHARRTARSAVPMAQMKPAGRECPAPEDDERPLGVLIDDLLEDLGTEAAYRRVRVDEALEALQPAALLAESTHAVAHLTRARDARTAQSNRRAPA